MLQLLSEAHHLERSGSFHKLLPLAHCQDLGDALTLDAEVLCPLESDAELPLRRLIVQHHDLLSEVEDLLD